MRLIATINAYDVMDVVCVTVRALDYQGDPEGLPRVAIAHRGEFQGTGESDPQQWLKDALIYLIESM